MGRARKISPIHPGRYPSSTDALPASHRRGGNGNIPPILWRLMQYMPRFLYAVGLCPLLGRNILRLTTVAARCAGGTFIVGSARGASGDWMRNLAANPNVEVRVGRRRIAGRAEVVTDVSKIADYLQRQMDRNPALFRRIIRMEGLSSDPSRQDFETLALKRTLAVIRSGNRC